MAESVQSVLAMLDALGKGDLANRQDEIGDYFAEDAVYHVQVPAMAIVRGRAAIVAELIRQTAHYSALETEVRSTIHDGRFVVSERVDHLTLPGAGARVANELVAVFEVDADGLIVAWREYWDSGALNKRIAAALGG